MLRKFIKLITFLFFLLSGVTWVAGEAGVGVSGRLIAADVLGVLIILLFFLVTLFASKGKFLLTNTHYAFVFLFLCFFISAVFSAFPNKAMFELIILFFIFLVSISLFNLWIYAELNPDELLKYILWSGAILSVIGLLQFLFFKGWFASSFGGLSGTFRNTGQAGAFFGVYLAILIPAFLSNKLRSNLYNLTLLFLLVLALIFTFKRAALIGVIFGSSLVLFKLFLSRDVKEKYLSVKIIFTVLFVAPIVIFTMAWGIDNVEGLQWRMDSKVNASTVQDFSEGFLAENIHYTLKAFELSPIIGVGLGNIAGNISTKYEIHSTYMAVLATGGVLACVTYLIFMSTWLKSLLNTDKTNEYRGFVFLIILMVFGLIVSWSYTYHIRKREFWILISITLFIHSNFNSKNKTLHR